MGSKNRISKYLLPILLKDRKEEQWFVEPFCGGCNLIDKVKGNRIANDSNYYLISLMRALQNSWEPPENLSYEEYYKIKNNMDTKPPELVAFAAFCCSFGGKWWGGYARSKDSKGNPRNHPAEAKRNLLKQAPKLKEIKFYNVDYKKLEIPDCSIIYCDPPYANTTKYKNSGFKHEELWKWCRIKRGEGHTVFVSEYNAPDDFTCVWQKELQVTVSKNSSNSYTKNVEKLFTLKD